MSTGRRGSVVVTEVRIAADEDDFDALLDQMEAVTPSVHDADYKNLDTPDKEVMRKIMESFRKSS
jgi:hypothetical protein